jgi:hypothetical protein
MAASFDNATQFRLTELRIDGKNVLPMFFSLKVYEHVMSSAVSGTLVLVETASNQFLANNNIEGNEDIDFSLTLPGDEILFFEGVINKIANRLVSPEGQTTYAVEFTTGTVRENENKFLSKRYSNTDPQVIIQQTVDFLNEGAEVPVKMDINKGQGYPMNYVASRWHPIRNIQYVQKHGVPERRGGETDIISNLETQLKESKGTGSFLFFETLKGYRFGSSVEFLAGRVGDGVVDKFEYMLAKNAVTMEQKRRSILTYENRQNNDTQTQLRSGAFKSKLISFDMDAGIYNEQTYESPFMTEKQKKLAKTPSRVMSKLYVNQGYNSTCDPANQNEYDQSRLYLQQGIATVNNITDGICQYTLPIRTDINVGDKVDITIYETGLSLVATADEKYSGRWVVSSVAHHFLLENQSAYTRISCLRATNQTDEASAEKVDEI